MSLTSAPAAHESQQPIPAILQKFSKRKFKVGAEGFDKLEKIALDGILAGFAGPDADRFGDLGNENFAVADAPGFGGA